MKPYELTALIADAYREAALRGADMSAAVECLETIRERFASSASDHDVWDALDDQIGISYSTTLQGVIHDLRNRFADVMTRRVMEAVAKALDESPHAAWETWLRHYGAALTEWRLNLCVALANVDTAVFPADPGAKYVRRMIDLIIKEEWAEVGGFLTWLAEQRSIDPIHRARILVIAAQVELYSLSRPEQALDFFERADSMAPEDSVVKSGLGEYWIHQGEFERGRELCQTSISLAPQISPGYELIGDSFEKQDDLQSAEEWYQEAVRQRPGDPEGLIRLIRLFGRKELFKERESNAVSLAERAVAVDPESEYRIYVEVAEAYKQNGRYEDARDWYDRAIASDPARAYGHTGKGYVLIDEGKFDEAHAAFARAVDIAGDVFEGHWGMSFADEYRGRPDEAVDHLRDALVARPSKESTILGRMGDLNRRMGNLSEAETDLLTALRLEPEDEAILESLHELADICYEREASLSLEDAFRIHESIRSVKGRAYDATYHNRIGNLHYYMSEFDDAIKSYGLAIEAAPDDAVIYSNLASAWERLDTPGRRLEALKSAIGALQQAFQLRADTEYATRLEDLRRRLSAASRFGELILTPPIVHPIALECAADLTDKFDPERDGWAVVYEDIPLMWDRIKDRLGIELPNVRLRENPALDSGEYTILIDEVPWESGWVVAGGHAAFTDPSWLEEVGIHLDEVAIGIDPITGDACSWLPERVREADHESADLVSDTDFIIRHLEHVMILNSWRFFTLHLAVGFIDENAPLALRKKDSLVGLARLLRALLRDGLPLTQPDVIFGVVSEISLSAADLPTAIERVRTALRAHLPGNAPGIRRVHLPESIEELLDSRLDGVSSVSLPPRDEHDLLLALRELDLGTRSVPVTRIPRRRPYLQRLLDGALPVEAGVLSEEEMVAKLAVAESSPPLESAQPMEKAP